MGAAARLHIRGQRTRLLAATGFVLAFGGEPDAADAQRSGQANVGRADRYVPDTQDPAHPDVIANTIYGDSPGDLAGTEVELDDVRVRAKSGNGLWVGYTRQRQIFVLPIDPSFVEFVTVGAALDVRGTLRETPSAAQAAKTFAMGAQSARKLAGDRFYIEAWTVSETD